MRAFVAAALLLAGCATDAWTPATLDAKDIQVHFLSETEWTEFQRSRVEGCDGSNPWGCLPPESAGVAYWGGEVCHVYFPAHRGMPSYSTIAHEIRHCYQGKHHP